MTSTPKTIQIFLPSGDPRGIRVAELTTRIVQVIEVPRSLLSAFQKMPEAKQVGLYFLVGSDETGDTPQVYIGQTGDLEMRLRDHNRKKDFWERALVLVSKTNSLTQTHALFLEWHCIQQVREAGRYADENGNSGSKPHTPQPLEADCMEIYDTGKTLLATLGYPLFTRVAEASEVSGEQMIYRCTGREADGRGMYTQEGFVVLAGSSGKADVTPSTKNRTCDRQRTKLKASGVMEEKDGRVVFLKNHVFRSPSTAAQVVMGRSANGWENWVSEDGRTLDEVERVSVEEAEEVEEAEV